MLPMRCGADENYLEEWKRLVAIGKLEEEERLQAWNLKRLSWEDRAKHTSSEEDKLHIR